MLVLKEKVWEIKTRDMGLRFHRYHKICIEIRYYVSIIDLTMSLF